jgi:outer membrane protein TolC
MGILVFVGAVATADRVNGADQAATNAVPVMALTLEDCVQLVLEHNLDIQVERINPGIAGWGVVREQGAFDPALTSRAGYGETTEPLDPERSASLGLDSIDTERLRLTAGLEGRLPTGTAYGITGFDARTSGTLSPDHVHVGTAALTLRQPLLQGFGTGPNTARIRVARSGQAIARQQLIGQVIDSVAQVSITYHELAFARENVKAAREDLARAQALFAENKRRVEVGVMSPLDVTQAEAGVAEREEAVIVAEQGVREQELALKRLIAANVTDLRGVRIDLRDPPRVEQMVTDADRSIQAALEWRPDYQEQLRQIERRDILVAFNRNQLWPSVDLEGSYGLNGRAGSFGSLVNDAASGDNPAWTVGVVVTIPLGNRQARANYNMARLEAEQALLDLKRLEQDIVVEIETTIDRVRTNLKRVEATRVATRLATESLKAEESKLTAGKSTSFLVLQAQAQLAAARSAEIRAMADYAQSLVNLSKAEGTTLRRYGIEVEETE